MYEDFNVVADNKTKETKHTNQLRTTTTIVSGRPQLPFRKFHLDIIDTLTWAVPSRFTCWLTGFPNILIYNNPKTQLI